MHNHSCRRCGDFLMCEEALECFRGPVVCEECIAVLARRLVRFVMGGAAAALLLVALARFIG